MPSPLPTSSQSSSPRSAELFLPWDSIGEEELLQATALLALRYNRCQPALFLANLEGDPRVMLFEHDASLQSSDLPQRIRPASAREMDVGQLSFSAVDFAFLLETATRPADAESIAASAREMPQGLVRIQFSRANRLVVECDDIASLRAKSDRIAGHFQNALKLLRSSKPFPVATTPIQTEEELETQLIAWNDNRLETEEGRFSFEYIDAIARAIPEAIAAEFQDQRLTYGELNRLSNQLARRFQGSGIGPNVVVAVHMRRSLDMVIALLALQRAGAAFLLIDPDMPRERSQHFVKRAAAKHLVTTGPERPAWAGSDFRIHLVDRLKSQATQEDASLPEHGLKAGDVSCVFFTSGTTGKPKGVMMTHHYRSPSDKTIEERIEQRGQISLVKASTGFTLILHEVFTPLQSGGTLLIAPQGYEKDMAWIARVVRDRAVSSLSFAPSLLSLFLEEPLAKECRSVKVVYTVGEELKPSVQRQFYATLPAAKLYLFYGCTEAPALTFREVKPGEDFGGRLVLGKASPNKKIYLIDPYRVPSPLGAAGEICGSGNISKGYINDPELTAARFITNPFSGEEEVMYRTGDLARQAEDGAIEFLGRSDFQVQIRGIRIELGEIESALESHAGVKKALLVARGQGGEAQLVAYYTSVSGDAIPEHRLRSRARQQMPEYMIPARFVHLEAFPLSPSGKIDRQSLPQPSKTDHEQRRIIQPYTTAQVELELIFKQVLKRDRVSIADSFFEIGGDSFLAVRALSRINRAFNSAIELPELYSHPSILQLERLVSQSGYRSPFKYLIKLQSDSGKPKLFAFCCSSSVQDFLQEQWSVHLMRALWYDRNFTYSDTLPEVSAAYGKEIMAVQPKGPYCLAGYSMGALLCLAFASGARKKGHTVARLHLVDPVAPPAKPENPSRSNLQHLLRHLARRRLLDQRVFTLAQLINLLRFPIPYRFQSRAAWFYVANLIATARPEPFDGDATLYVRSNYSQDHIGRWRGLIQGNLSIVSLPARTHAEMDEPSMQRLWCEALGHYASRSPQTGD